MEKTGRSINRSAQFESGIPLPQQSEVNCAGPGDLLKDLLTNEIRTHGEISFRDWMFRALYEPRLGYYCKGDCVPWGRAGDFRTSPERSHLFAVTFARYFAKLHEQSGSPDRWTIVECGGGDGTLATTLLKSLKANFPQVFAVTNYVFDETSTASLLKAKDRLLPFADRVRYQTLSELDQIKHGVVFANELLDAFPVHRVTKRNGQLFELFVSLSESEQFVWDPRPISNDELIEFLETAGIALAESQIVEINLEIERWLKLVAAKLARGFLITVDYGDEEENLYRQPERLHGTLRGYREHQFVENILAEPGNTDITTTVDWTHVMRAGKKNGFAVREFARQDKFLLENGFLDELTQRLAVEKSDAARLVLSNESREMILPGGMSSSFQVLVQERVVADGT